MISIIRLMHRLIQWNRATVTKCHTVFFSVQKDPVANESFWLYLFWDIICFMIFCVVITLCGSQTHPREIFFVPYSFFYKILYKKSF